MLKFHKIIVYEFNEVYYARVDDSSGWQQLEPFATLWGRSFEITVVLHALSILFDLGATPLPRMRLWWTCRFTSEWPNKEDMKDSDPEVVSKLNSYYND